jgi:hypothetical protein
MLVQTIEAGGEKDQREKSKYEGLFREYTKMAQDHKTLTGALAFANIEMATLKVGWDEDKKEVQEVRELLAEQEQTIIKLENNEALMLQKYQDVCSRKNQLEKDNSKIKNHLYEYIASEPASKKPEPESRKKEEYLQTPSPQLAMTDAEYITKKTADEKKQGPESSQTESLNHRFTESQDDILTLQVSREERQELLDNQPEFDLEESRVEKKEKKKQIPTKQMKELNRENRKARKKICYNESTEEDKHSEVPVTTTQSEVVTTAHPEVTTKAKVETWTEVKRKSLQGGEPVRKKIMAQLTMQGAPHLSWATDISPDSARRRIRPPMSVAQKIQKAKVWSSYISDVTLAAVLEADYQNVDLKVAQACAQIVVDTARLATLARHALTGSSLCHTFRTQVVGHDLKVKKFRKLLFKTVVTAARGVDAFKAMLEEDLESDFVEKPSDGIYPIPWFGPSTEEIKPSPELQFVLANEDDIGNQTGRLKISAENVIILSSAFNNSISLIMQNILGKLGYQTYTNLRKLFLPFEWDNTNDCKRSQYEICFDLSIISPIFRMLVSDPTYIIAGDIKKKLSTAPCPTLIKQHRVSPIAPLFSPMWGKEIIDLRAEDLFIESNDLFKCMYASSLPNDVVYNKLADAINFGRKIDRNHSVITEAPQNK